MHLTYLLLLFDANFFSLLFSAHEFDARRRMISKNFHHVMRVSERQLLVGPPESMREHVVAASKAMKKGDWRACINFIINEKMNAKVRCDRLIIIIVKSNKVHPIHRPDMHN